MNKLAQSIVASLLTKYLGDFLELDQGSLSIDISSGVVQQRNLRFRQEALSDLNLPVSIKLGLLGKLSGA